MTKPVALFLIVTSGLVAAYLAITALILMASATRPVDDVLVRGIWIAFGAVAIVCVCSIFGAASERQVHEHHHAES